MHNATEPTGLGPSGKRRAKGEGQTMAAKEEFKPATRADWDQAAAKAAPGGDVSALDWVTPEGLTVKPLYTADDVTADPGLPGFAPFTRGVKEDRARDSRHGNGPF